VVPPSSRLILAVLAAAPLSARAGEFAPTPPVPGMALTLPGSGMATGAPVPLAPVPSPAATAPPAPVPPPAQADLTGPRRPRTLGSGFPSTDGQLPNQRTGPRRERVVHDICIGC
jgi:hypothetical protein